MDVTAAAAALRAGALVGMPTETVYGLAANACDDRAVLRIFEAKGRPHFDPLIVHVADAEQAWTVAEPSPRALRLAAAYWPGPLTLILPRRACIGDSITSGLDFVGVRVPDHPLALALIRAAGVPLAAPSANLFGCISPTTAAHVIEQLGDRIAGVVDGGPCRVGVESTVLRPDPVPLILRPGGIAQDALQALLGEPVAVADRQERAESLPQAAPGMLASHYAPRIPLRLLGDQPWPTAAHVARLVMQRAPRPGGPTEILSPTGDVAEIAMRLFAAMRRLDASGASEMVAELTEPVGLGVAINDRLRRAAGLG